MIAGSCLCGGVRFEIDGRYSAIGLCHCYKCRKVSGAASNAVLLTSSNSLRWVTGEELIVEYLMPDGHWKSVFCRQCGCPVPLRGAAGKLYWVPAGSLDDDPDVDVDQHIHVDGKASWDQIGGDAAQHPGEAPPP